MSTPIADEIRGYLDSAEIRDPAPFYDLLEEIEAVEDALGSGPTAELLGLIARTAKETMDK